MSFKCLLIPHLELSGLPFFPRSPRGTPASLCAQRWGEATGRAASAFAGPSSPPRCLQPQASTFAHLRPLAGAGPPGREASLSRKGQEGLPQGVVSAVIPLNPGGSRW